MSFRMYDTFSKIEPKHLNTLESQIGIGLPPSYKKFLLKSNGGRIAPNTFNTANNEYETDVHFLFGVTTNKNYDLETNFWNWIQESKNKNLIPIGTDSIGNLILISCMAPTYESVYLWIHDQVNQLYLITGDFNSFLNGLYEFDLEKNEMDLAVARQDISFFENMLLEGKNIDDIQNEFNQSVVQVAALHNKVGLLNYFKKKGSKLKNALISAAGNGHIEAVKYLLSVGVDINEGDQMQNNDTALIQAVLGGHLNVVKELIKRGADVNATDKFGQTALTKSRWLGNDEMIAYLIKHGAKE